MIVLYRLDAPIQVIMRRPILIARAERITRCGYQPLFHHQDRIMSSSFLKEAVTIPATAKHTATVS